MEEYVMRDLRGARNLLKAYVRNRDYRNAGRVLKDIGNYIEGLEGRAKDMAVNDFAAMMDEFVTPGEAMFKSLKNHEFIGDKQNEELLKKRLGNYFDLNPAEAEFLGAKELMRVLKPAEESKFGEAEEHVRNASFYINSGKKNTLMESIGLGTMILNLRHIKELEAIEKDFENRECSYVN